jgi:hypothetical protein
MKAKMVFPGKLAAVCCVWMLFAVQSRLLSQIVYTDIPDATPNATYSLDLNNDSIVDFFIQFDLGDKVMCKPQNNNAYAGNLVGGVHLPWALSAAASICDSLAMWYGPNDPGTMAWGTGTGYWAGAADKYLALKLNAGANTYYGWARLDLLPTATSFTLKDYAYESTPNACIQSGQMVLSVDEQVNKYGFSVVPNPFTSSASIRVMDNLKNATLTVFNAGGQAVRQIENLSGQTLSFSRDNLPGGLYFMRLTEANQTIATGKVIMAD